MRVDLRCGIRLWVDQIAEFFRGFEEGYFLCGNVNFGAGFGITANARVALPRAEAAEAADFDFIPGFERADDRVEENVDDDFTVTASQIAQGCDFVDEVGFSQFESPSNPGQDMPAYDSGVTGDGGGRSRECRGSFST